LSRFEPLFRSPQNISASSAFACVFIVGYSSDALQGKGDTPRTLILEIPETITQAMRLPPQQQKRQVLIELALSLYAQDILSMGKARELSTLEKREFIDLLGERQISRHYAVEDLEEDIAYAGRQ
jgi:predicted HTH domain antitoxin